MARSLSLVSFRSLPSGLRRAQSASEMRSWRRQGHSVSPHPIVELRKHIDTNPGFQFRNRNGFEVLTSVIGCEVGRRAVSGRHIDRLENVARHENAAL